MSDRLASSEEASDTTLYLVKQQRQGGRATILLVAFLFVRFQETCRRIAATIGRPGAEDSRSSSDEFSSGSLRLLWGGGESPPGRNERPDEFEVGWPDAKSYGHRLDTDGPAANRCR